MTGIALLALAALWIWAVKMIATAVARRFAPGVARWSVGLPLFTVLLPLPVVDEILARYQIAALCREGAVLKIDEQKIKGRKVKITAEPLNAEVHGIAIPVSYTKIVFRDTDTREELGSRGWYNIKGGWLIRVLGFSESNSPLTIEAYCAPGEGEHEAAARLGFKIIN